jgi:hypothetical protein
MRGLSARDVVAVWERGQERHPVDRALLLLGAALPARSRDELASLTVGQRDGLLLLARERTLGGTLQCYVPCPACALALEFPVEVREILVADPTAPVEREHEVEAEGVAVRFRLLDSRDLAAVARVQDPAAARQTLLRRAVVWARAGGEAVPPDFLPPAAREAVAAELARQDPQSEVEFALRCHGCAHQWLSLLDVAGFFWAEITVSARRLLRDVHALARAYGWREADVLGMSAARRAYYLELVQ